MTGRDGGARFTPETGFRFTAAACRIFLGVVFLAAAAHKIADPAAFAEAIFRYRILPGWAINAVALILPWVEVAVAGGLLFTRGFRDAGAAVALVLLALFTLAIGGNLLRGIDVACGCFTSDPAADAAGARNLVRNIGLMVMAAVALLTAPGGPGLDRLTRIGSRPARHVE